MRCINAEKCKMIHWSILREFKKSRINVTLLLFLKIKVAYIFFCWVKELSYIANYKYVVKMNYEFRYEAITTGDYLV